MLVIPYVIFNLNFQFNKKFPETSQILLMIFQSVNDFVCKE